MQIVDSEFFFAVAWVALVVHMLAFMGAACLEWVSNPRGWTRGLSSVNGLGKLFTARRRDVRLLFAWGLIWSARLTLPVALAAVIVGLTLHNL